jgi:hypothetical protein
MSATKPAGSSAGSSNRRNEISGWAVVTTMGASMASPLARVTPVTWPSLVRICATSASVLTCAPNIRAARDSAPDTPPMPPRGNPQAPAAPSVSPMWWCSITYAVPAERGPAQVPITPDTDSRPSIASLSKYPSIRSAILLVSSRVMSTAARSSTPRRLVSSRAWRSRSCGRRDPSRGGIWCSSGPSSRPRVARCSSYRG